MAPDNAAHDDGDPHAIELEVTPPPREIVMIYRGPGPKLPRKPVNVRRSPKLAAQRVQHRSKPRS